MKLPLDSHTSRLAAVYEFLSELGQMRITRLAAEAELVPDGATTTDLAEDAPAPDTQSSDNRSNERLAALP